MFAVRRWLCGRTGEEGGVKRDNGSDLGDKNRSSTSFPSAATVSASEAEQRSWRRGLLLPEEEISSPGKGSVADGADAGRLAPIKLPRIVQTTRPYERLVDPRRKAPLMPLAAATPRTVLVLDPEQIGRGLGPSPCLKGRRRVFSGLWQTSLDDARCAGQCHVCLAVVKTALFRRRWELEMGFESTTRFACRSGQSTQGQAVRSRVTSLPPTSPFLQ